MIDVMAFFQLHSDLPREGPGDRDSLNWAMRLARPPADGQILDMAAGPGADIADLLAHVPQGRVTALDRHQPFVDRIVQPFEADGRVTACQGDMLEPPDGPFDVIWCAGAVYFKGVAACFEAWRRVLAPDGAIVFSDAIWLTPDPSAAARANWEDYREMTDAAGVVDRIERAGFRSLGAEVLSAEAWEAYYQPMEQRIARLGATAPDAALAEVLEEARQEIAAWRDHGHSFGYALFVAVAQ